MVVLSCEFTFAVSAKTPHKPAIFWRLLLTTVLDVVAIVRADMSQGNRLSGVLIGSADRQTISKVKTPLN
jgi:hypothetical protein